MDSVDIPFDGKLSGILKLSFGVAETNHAPNEAFKGCAHSSHLVRNPRLQILQVPNQANGPVEQGAVKFKLGLQVPQQ